MGDGDRSLTCERGHLFDLARQGYVNLRGQTVPRHADTAAMVAARDRFLGAGHYAPIAEELRRLVGGPNRQRLLDVGTGTGYYLSWLLDGLPGARGVGLDVSVAAARRAARAHTQLGAVVADAWQPLPIADSSVDVVLTVFAPRNAEEFVRVLAPTGVLLTVTPQPGHLAEMRTALDLLDIQADKDERLRDTFAGVLAEQSQASLSYPLVLGTAALHDLVAMGPNAFHLHEPEIAQLVASVPTPATATVAVRVTAWAAR